MDFNYQFTRDALPSLESVGTRDEGGKYKSALAVNERLVVERPTLRSSKKLGSNYAVAGNILDSAAPNLIFDKLDSGISNISQDYHRKVDPFKHSVCDDSIPPQPEFLCPHNFYAVDSKNIIKFDDIKTRVEIVLTGRVEVSFDYVSTEYAWNVIYVRGASSYKGKISIYRASNGVLMIEFQRLSGDSIAFNSMFRELKEEVTNNQNMTRYEPPVYPIPLEKALGENEQVLALKPLVEMACEPFLDTQFEAARVFCEMSQQPSMHVTMRDAGCIPAMVELVKNGLESTREHALLTLANLSSNICCQETIIDAGLLPILLTHAVNVPFHSSIMARESARLLANLSDRLAARVVSAIGEQELRTWMDSVDTFKDSFVKQQAIRARMSLSPLILC